VRAMARILITTDYLRPGDEVDELLRSRGHETRYRSGDLTADLAEVEGALVGHDPLTAEVLASADRLRAVVRTGVGYDAIDVEAAARAGITVSNLPGINANAVAEYTIGLLLAAARHLVQSATGVASGGWPREDGRELRGSVLGLIGYGAAARAVVPLRPSGPTRRSGSSSCPSCWGAPTSSRSTPHSPRGPEECSTLTRWP
jgi:phosphoglycerate dehydrogenase-like enzyme